MSDLDIQRSAFTCFLNDFIKLFLHLQVILAEVAFTGITVMIGTHAKWVSLDGVFLVGGGGLLFLFIYNFFLIVITFIMD